MEARDRKGVRASGYSGSYNQVKRYVTQSPLYIMWKPALGIDWGETIGEYGFLTGEARFREDDAIAVWDWITTTPQPRGTILP